MTGSVNVLPLRHLRDSRPLDTRVADPVLYWAIRGTVVIRADRGEHRLSAGSALWVPRATEVRVRLGPGDVVVPVIGIPAGSYSRTVRLRVEPALRPWLLYAFATQLGHLDGAAGREVRERIFVAPAGAGTLRPELPASRDLRDLAEALVRSPERNVGAVVRESLVGYSERTVQRRFLAETGRTPSRWARSMRAARAAEYLERGRSVEWVAHAVGYRSVSGFSRMFQEETGIRPALWTDEVSRLPDAAPVLSVDSEGPLPAQRTWSRVNGSHVAVWVVYGTACCTVGGHTLQLNAGDAVILPAGIHNSMAADEGSLLLPVGYRSGRECAIGRPVAPARVPPEYEDELVRAAVSAYTPLAQPGSDVHAGFEFVRSRAEHREPSDEDALMATLASAAAFDEIAAPSLPAYASLFGISERQLSRIVNRRTGMTFAQWLRTSRMSRARVRVHSGEQPTVVSRRLGYANLPAFSRAFREVHGTSAQEVASVGTQGGEALRWRAAVFEHVMRS